MTPGRWRARLAIALCVAAAACATAGPPAPAGPPPFQGIRTVVLVRGERTDDREGGRPRDALDGLAQALAERGIATRLVEAGPGVREEWKDVARLAREAEDRIAAAPPSPVEVRPTARLGDRPGALLQRIGADAFALLVRGADRTRARGPGPGGPWTRDPWGTPPPPGPRLPPAGPPTALALVDRGGTLVWFDWGPSADGRDEPSRPVNAADAVTEAVRVLAGEPAAEDR